MAQRRNCPSIESKDAPLGLTARIPSQTRSQPCADSKTRNPHAKVMPERVRLNGDHGNSNADLICSKTQSHRLRSKHVRLVTIDQFQDLRHLDPFQVSRFATTEMKELPPTRLKDETSRFRRKLPLASFRFAVCRVFRKSNSNFQTLNFSANKS